MPCLKNTFTKFISKSMGGRRCVVFGCSNTSFDGYAMYSAKNVKDNATKLKWFNFIEAKRKDFCRKEAISVYICDDHFSDKSFNQSHLVQFQTKCQTIPYFF